MKIDPNAPESTIRQKLEAISRKWSGHDGVNYSKTSDDALLMLIADAVDYDHQRIMNLSDLYAQVRVSELNREEKP